MGTQERDALLEQIRRGNTARQQLSIGLLKEKPVKWRDAINNPPSDTLWVLVYGDGAMATRAWNNDKRRWEDWEGCTMPGLNMESITHWMPLPDCPEESS